MTTKYTLKWQKNTMPYALVRVCLRFSNKHIFYMREQNEQQQKNEIFVKKLLPCELKMVAKERDV